jgi:hypothetical protein
VNFCSHMPMCNQDSYMGFERLHASSRTALDGSRRPRNWTLMSSLDSYMAFSRLYRSLRIATCTFERPYQCVFMLSLDYYTHL